MSRKLHLLSTGLAALLVAVLQGCDAADAPGPRAVGAVAERGGCAEYVVIGIWGQSNALRGDRRGELANGAELDRAVELGGGLTNVLRQNPGGTYTQMHDEARNGGITSPDRKTAYVDLANRIYQRWGYCTVFSPATTIASVMQYHADPQRFWDPAHDGAGDLFDPALARLRQAVRDYAPVHTFVYLNQGLSDAVAVYENIVQGGSAPVSIHGWGETFAALAAAADAALRQDGVQVRFLLSLAETDWCLVPTDPLIDSLLTSLQNVQRRVPAVVPFARVTSAIQADSATASHTVDGHHLRWTQYLHCENPAIFDGIAHFVAGRRGWRAPSTCRMAYPDPPVCTAPKTSGDRLRLLRD